MSKYIHVVVPDNIRDTGAMSYMFMLREGVPTDDLLDCSDVWGYAKRSRKTPTHLDPWKFVRGEVGAVGDDGVKRWNINLFNADGFRFGGGVDETSDQGGLKRLLADSLKDVDGAVFLIAPDDIEIFGAACRDLGIEIQQHRVAGEISTS